MKILNKLAIAAVSVCLFACSSSKNYQEAINEMSQEEIAQKYAEAGTPSDIHEWIERNMAGEWKTTSKHWNDATQPPEVSEGTSNISMVLGGRYLKQYYNGTAMNQPFKGVGYLGYDNTTGKFISNWLDSMSTGIMTSVGNLDDNTGSIVLEGVFTCPITGTPREVKSITTIINEDKHVFEMFEEGDEGDVKILEIEYDRTSS